MSPRLPTLTQRAVVDASNGNIALHGRGAVTLAYGYLDTSTDARIVLGGAVITFEIFGQDAVQAVPGADAYTVNFTLSQALIAALPLNQAIPFAVNDQTTFGQPTVLWSGYLTVYGFQQAPP